MSDPNLFALGLEIYNRLQPELENRPVQPETPVWGLEPQVHLPALQDILQSAGALPPRTFLIGNCADGVPFFIDTSRVGLGALLVTGDPHSGKTRQLQVMVASAVALNHPHEMQVCVLTHDPDEWTAVCTQAASQDQLLGIYPFSDSETHTVIRALVELAEDRRYGKRSSASVLFVIDDLEWVSQLDYEDQNNLHWLLQYGSRSGIWLVASLDACLAGELPFWVDVFRTRLLGQIKSPSLADYLSISSNSPAPQLTPGIEFTVRTGPGWMKYIVPSL